MTECHYYDPGKQYICAICESKLDTSETENRRGVVRVYHCEKCCKDLSRFYYGLGQDSKKQEEGV